MAIFGVETDRAAIVRKYMRESNERLQKKSMISNPFYGRIVRVPSSDQVKDYYVVDMDPVYPKIYLIGIFTMIVALFFTGFRLTYWLVPSFVFFSCGIFWSKYFYYVMLKLGLKKAGYNKKLKLITSNATISRLIDVIV